MTPEELFKDLNENTDDVITFKKLIEVFKKYNIPEDAKIYGDSGWECGPTKVEAVYYNPETNEVILAQDEDFPPNSVCDQIPWDPDKDPIDAPSKKLKDGIVHLKWRL